MPLGRLLRATTELALRLERLRPGVLDGPAPDPGLARRVADEPRPDPRDLVVDAVRLRRETSASGLPPVRRRHLDAVQGALDCHARSLAGERPRYVDEVRALFGVTPRRADPDEYREAHRRLADLLPGRGPVAPRMRTYREADVVPLARLGAAVAALTTELRRRTRDQLGLATGEHAAVELVGERPWTAFTRYRGGFRSRVSITTAARVRGGALLPLLAHETYPGHHTQYCRAEAASARYPELGLRLVHGPQGLVAEGAAEVAAAVIPGPGWGAVAQRALAGVGVRIDGAVAERVEAELDLLGRVRLDAALLRHVDGAGPDEVVAYLARWLLVPPERARRILAFLEHPQWRAYPVTYAEGAPLVRGWLARHPDGPVAGLRALLDAPVLPADLVTVGGDTPCGGSAAVGSGAPGLVRLSPWCFDERARAFRVVTALIDVRRYRSCDERQVTTVPTGSFSCLRRRVAIDRTRVTTSSVRVDGPYPMRLVREALNVVSNAPERAGTRPLRACRPEDRHGPPLPTRPASGPAGPTQSRCGAAPAREHP